MYERNFYVVSTTLLLLYFLRHCYQIKWYDCVSVLPYASKQKVAEPILINGTLEEEEHVCLSFVNSLIILYESWITLFCLHSIRGFFYPMWVFYFSWSVECWFWVIEDGYLVQRCNLAFEITSNFKMVLKVIGYLIFIKLRAKTCNFHTQEQNKILKSALALG